MIDDRMARGIAAGAVGALVQNLYALIAKPLGLTETMYVDYSRAILFYRVEKGMLAILAGLAGHFIVDIVLGVIFAYLIYYTSSKYYLIKAIVFSGTAWYIIKGMTTSFYRVPLFVNVSPKTVVFYLTGSILFGITIAVILKKLDDVKVE